MAAEGSSAFSSILLANQPKGPFFIDTGACQCALQEILDQEAWRCISVNATENIYQGNDGKWYFAVDQNNSASITDSKDSDSNPPDTGTEYEIQDDQFQPFSDSNVTATAVGVQNLACTGQNDTTASGQYYERMDALVSGQMNPCWQPGTVPLVIQTQSSWNKNGCNLGFLCKQTHLATSLVQFS